MELRNDIRNPRSSSRMARAQHVLRDGEDSDAGPGGIGNRQIATGAVIGNPRIHLCSKCGRQFSSSIGLGVHFRSAHPVEANAAVVVDRVKLRWNPEEVGRLARAEATAMAQGVKFMNLHLETLFPERTLEAIKGKRRDPNYRAMVQEYYQQGLEEPEPDDGEGDPDPSGGSGPSSSESTLGTNAAPRIMPPGTPVLSNELAWAIRQLVEDTKDIQVYQAERLRRDAMMAIEGNLGGEQVAKNVSSWLGAIFPPKRRLRQPRTKASTAKPAKVENGEQRRRREYAKCQELYKKSLGACLKWILEGDSAGERPSAREFDAYWRPLMETRSAESGRLDDCPFPLHPPEERPRTPLDRRTSPPVVGASAEPMVSRGFDKSSLWRPITAIEVAGAVVRTGSSPGPDGIEPRRWNAIPLELRALLYNLLLLARVAPASLTDSHTVFIEKGGMPDRPAASDYRPLSIGNVGIRQFHKILARRLMWLDVVDTRQRAFRSADGVCENTAVLSSVLREARQKCRTLHVATIDVSKAFDTVAHEAIHTALDELGLPAEFREYVRNTYAGAATVLKLPGHVGPPVKIGRGVRQGDPLSPLLFNLVVDRALGTLSREVGYKLGSVRVGALAYADDIVLLSRTAAGLRENLRRIEYALGKCGLTMNTNKSAVLSLVASGREKKVKVVEEPCFRLGGRWLPQQSPLDVWRYLGNTYKGAREDGVDTKHESFKIAVERLTRAPLKPQQRLRLLRCCLLPRYYHSWVVSLTNTKALKRMDVLVRGAIRSWLRLPNDVPTGYFHAPIQAGGLGFPLLRVFIPILKHRRLRALCQSSLPVAQAAAETDYVARQTVWCEKHMRLNDVRVTKMPELGKQCTMMLRESNDGRGLRESSRSKLSSLWVSSDAGGIPGSDFVHYHHVRANCLPSRARVSRGRGAMDKQCRAGCPETETPAHCVQRCFRTHFVARIIELKNEARERETGKVAWLASLEGGSRATSL